LEINAMTRAMGVEEGLRELLLLVPQVTARLKRSPAPAELRATIAAGALGPRHVTALSYLLYEGPMTVGELAGRLGVTHATASLMVGQISRGGLIERREDEQDRRRTIVEIASLKRRAIDRWLSSRTGPMRRTLERLSPRDRGVFVEALRLLDSELQAG
jgi:DNA-binding MarR family transcriptional regulator